MWALTGTRLVRLEVRPDRLIPSTAHRGEAFTSLAMSHRTPSTLFLGSSERGLRRSRDGGASWERLALDQAVFSLAVSPADGAVYAGCEPSKLFRSVDDGDSWLELTALLDIPSAPTWSFPPRPWTSHVRTIAPHPEDAARLLVGIELGGVMSTADGGKTWDDHRPGAERDAHELAWHPSATDRAYEAGGGGAARSADGGRTWQRADRGRGDDTYCWALALDPADPDRWFVSACPDAAHAHYLSPSDCRIYRWDGDGSFTPVMEGLPLNPLDMLVTTLLVRDGELWAATRDGRVFRTGVADGAWREMPVEGEGLQAVVSLHRRTAP